MSPRRVGLLGGTFDPVHAGHVDLALACASALRRDEIRLVPARTPPHKPPAVASVLDRWAMVALAAADHDALVPDARELRRDGPSWTIDTIEEILGEDPSLDLHLLVGAASRADIATWRRWQDVVARAKVVATGRAGIDMDAVAARAAAALPPGRLEVVAHEPPPWSSRQIRRRLAEGDPCRDALDARVADYIAKTGTCYRREETTR